MILIIDHHNGVPAYRQIMEQVKFQIASGVLLPGVELPSTRALSTELSMNPMTISKAYNLLEREGVLERRRGQTLTVRALTADDLHAHKLTPLRRQLASAATMARQLGVSPTQAMKLFRETLESCSE